LALAGGISRLSAHFFDWRNAHHYEAGSNYDSRRRNQRKAR
jgi:hypothetical protein